MKKKILAILLTTVMALSLVACGSEKSTSADGDSASETGDSKISALRLKPQQMSDSICADWHPSEKTHEKASKQLIDVITKERINY